MNTTLPGTDDAPPPHGHAGGWIPPIHRVPPCGARTREGGPCRAPTVRGKSRCRMHGGAAGAGAPRGNRNAWRHGWWSAREAAARRRAAALLEEGARMLGELAQG